MNSDNERKLSGKILFIKYLLRKLNIGLSDGISQDEFSNFTKELLEYMNKESTYLYSIDEENLEKIYSSIIESDGQLCGWGEVLKFQNCKIFPAYKFSEWTVISKKYDFYKMTNFLSSYFKKNYEDKKQEISNFNLKLVPEKVLTLSKQISVYIVRDLMVRYVKRNIERKAWPEQCKDIDEYIIKKDLAGVIELDGTRDNFIQLYNHSIRSIAQMIMNDENLQLSNDQSKPLAYSNFLKIISPFPFISSYIYHSTQLRNKNITINLQKEEASLSEIQCVYSDPYGDFSDDFEHNNTVLSSKEQYVHFEKSISKYIK